MTEKERAIRLTKQNGQTELNRAAAAEIAKMFPDGNIDENAVVDVINEAYGADIFTGRFDRNGNEITAKAYDVWNHNSAAIRDEVMRGAAQTIEKNRTFKIDGFKTDGDMLAAFKNLWYIGKILAADSVANYVKLWVLESLDLQHTATTGKFDDKFTTGRNILIRSSTQGGGKSTMVNNLLANAEASGFKVLGGENQLPSRDFDFGGPIFSKYQLVSIKEYDRSDRIDWARVKNIGRREDMRYREMYSKGMMVPSRATVIVTSNESDVGALGSDRSFTVLNTLPATYDKIAKIAKIDYDENAPIFTCDPERLKRLLEKVEGMEDYDSGFTVGRPEVAMLRNAPGGVELFEVLVRHRDALGANTRWSAAGLCKICERAGERPSKTGINRTLQWLHATDGGLTPRASKSTIPEYVKYEIGWILDVAADNPDAMDGGATMMTLEDEYNEARDIWVRIMGFIIDDNGGGGGKDTVPPDPEGLKSHLSHLTSQMDSQSKRSEMEKVLEEKGEKGYDAPGDTPLCSSTAEPTPDEAPSAPPVLHEMPDFRLTTADLLQLRTPVCQMVEYDVPDPDKPGGLEKKCFIKGEPQLHMDDEMTHIVAEEYTEGYIKTHDPADPLVQRGGIMRPVFYVFEADGTPVAEQERIFEAALQAHPDAPASICLSGGKSVHMLVKIPEDERDSVAKDFKYYCEKAAERMFGADAAILDRRVWTRARLARLPGAWRPYKKARQTALYINWGAPGLSMRAEIDRHEAEKEKEERDRQFKAAARRMRSRFERRTGGATPLDRLKAMQRDNPTDARAFAIDILEDMMPPSGSNMVGAIKSIKWLSDNVSSDFEPLAREVYDRCRDAHPSNICSAYEEL